MKNQRLLIKIISTTVKNHKHLNETRKIDNYYSLDYQQELVKGKYKNRTFEAIFNLSAKFERVSEVLLCLKLPEIELAGPQE